MAKTEPTGQPATASNARQMMIALAVAATFVFLLCWFFDPMWMVNDDVGMSMVAHGYGTAAIGSPNLVFSNVLWGYWVRAIPEIKGVLGYSIATLGILVVVGTVVVYGLRRLDVGCVACLAALALILTRPILFPTFTINAGLLLVAAIILWRLTAQTNDYRVLAAGCLLAFTSYLVRSQEFLLVLAVALPLIPWRVLQHSLTSKIILVVLGSAIAIASAFDHQAYERSEWKAFKELNPARALITDFGAGERLKMRPDILQRYAFSTNDVDLIRTWFFIDPKIANPQALRAMVAELGHLPNEEIAFRNALLGVYYLLHPTLLPLVLAALLLAMLRPKRAVAATWGLCIAAVFVLGLIGRPGVLRVYIPLVGLLVVAPLLLDKASALPNRLGVFVLLVAGIVNAALVFSESNTANINAERIRNGIASFPNEPVVAWGSAFPFEAVYPVLGATPSAMAYRIYGLGVFTLAPFSVAFAEQQQGRGMTNLLVKAQGVPIIADDQSFIRLGIYCREHLHGKLKEISATQHGAVVVSRRLCNVRN